MVIIVVCAVTNFHEIYLYDCYICSMFTLHIIFNMFGNLKLNRTVTPMNTRAHTRDGKQAAAAHFEASQMCQMVFCLVWQQQIPTFKHCVIFFSLLLLLLL